MSNRTRPEKKSYDDDIIECGLIILGNSGAGKSFLANILIGREVFVHKYTAASVTHVTEYEEVEVGDYNLAIFNIPGLIEAEQERIDLNKIEIDKAFAKRPNSVVMFVFGQSGGRISSEDITAYQAINEAYPFKAGSLMLAINGLPKEREKDYEGVTITLLQKLLTGPRVSNDNICFLNKIDQRNASERQHLREKLLQVVTRCVPSVHTKVKDIETILDKLKEQLKRVEQHQSQIEREREKLRIVIQENQRQFNEAATRHQSEMQSMRLLIQRQEQQEAERQRRHEEECKNRERQIKELREAMKREQRAYEEHCRIRQQETQRLASIQQSINETRARIAQLEAEQAHHQQVVVVRSSRKRSSCVIS